MRIIDRNGRLFGKISIIDVLVIAVVVVLGAAVYVKSSQPHTGGGSAATQTITYQVLVEAAPDYLEQSIHVGDQVYDQVYESGGALGEITEIQVLPGSTMCTSFTDGTVGLVEVEESHNLLLTIRGEGLINDQGYSINRVYDLGINSSRTYYSKYAQFNVTVTDILS